MAAFGASTVTATYKRGRKSTVGGINAVTQQVFSFVIPASSTVAGPIDISGATVPPGTACLGMVISPSASLATTQLKITSGSTDIAAKAAYTAEAGVTVNGVILNASSATSNAQLKATTSDATSPSSDVTVTVTLFLGCFGQEIGRAAAVGN
jgi:hypothetical protein